VTTDRKRNASVVRAGAVGDASAHREMVKRASELCTHSRPIRATWCAARAPGYSCVPRGSRPPSSANVPNEGLTCADGVPSSLRWMWVDVGGNAARALVMRRSSVRCRCCRRSALQSKLPADTLAFVLAEGIVPWGEAVFGFQ
jgi:hypothetical protein